MPNTYFQFKQFRIEQHRCSMKVCTDACIQGAYAADWLTQRNKVMKHILDIGTGTGLLTLMLAQKEPSVHFDAIELNQQAYLQAKENFTRSPWSGNISVIHGDIKTVEAHQQYDFIICNPPFYEDEMKSLTAYKNQSKHSTSLRHEELAQTVSNLISESGDFCVMLPEKQFNRFILLLEKDNLYPSHLVKIRQTPLHPWFRIIGFFNNKKNYSRADELTISDGKGKYTSQFKDLLKDYYLYLEA